MERREAQRCNSRFYRESDYMQLVKELSKPQPSAVNQEIDTKAENLQD